MYKIGMEDVKKLRAEMQREKNVNAYKRLQAVALRGEGLKNAEISEITGFHKQWVGQLCRTYSIEGIEGLTNDGRTGGNNRHMTDEQAKAFLSQFEDAAAQGQIITVEEIAVAYDEAVGVKHKSLSTLYYFLHTHGWRKVTPKQYHPGKASEEVIAASKKLTMS